MDYRGGHPLRLEYDPVYGYVARFEIRNGDVPPFGGPERTEIRGTQASGGLNGQTRWYEFSHAFPPGWTNDGQWGATQQFHSNLDGVPPISFGWTKWDGVNNDWVMRIGGKTVWHTPIDTSPHHTTLEVKWSTGNDGYVKLWYDGVPQRLGPNGVYQLFGPTQNPGSTWVYFKQGIYRESSATSTRVMYQTGFRAASSPAGLTWDITKAG